MSESPPHNAVPDIETRIIAQLFVYTTIKDARNKIKETKVPKVKELDFSVSREGYVDFLDTMLSKHAQERFKVTERRPYPFKYLYPPSKACVTSFSYV